MDTCAWKPDSVAFTIAFFSYVKILCRLTVAIVVISLAMGEINKVITMVTLIHFKMLIYHLKTWLRIESSILCGKYCFNGKTLECTNFSRRMVKEKVCSE